jgi:hypothetical protein
VSIDPKYSMVINIVIAVLGVIVASTAELTTIFGQHDTQIIVAASGITLGVIGAINSALHGYSPPAAGPLAKTIMSAVGVALMLALAASAQAAERTSTRSPGTPSIPAPAPVTSPLICDPLNLLPGCHVQATSPSGVAATQPIELSIWAKIVNAALPDLEYASALAMSAGTSAAGVRKQCWDALIAANKIASGTSLKDSAGNTLARPDPHLFTDAEQFAELIDNLAPSGPLWTSCAGAAQLAGTNVLTFINAAVTGASGLAALGVT